MNHDDHVRYVLRFSIALFWFDADWLFSRLVFLLCIYKVLIMFRIFSLSELNSVFDDIFMSTATPFPLYSLVVQVTGAPYHDSIYSIPITVQLLVRKYFIVFKTNPLVIPGYSLVIQQQRLRIGRTSHLTANVDVDSTLEQCWYSWYKDSM